APVKQPIWTPTADRMSNANMTRFIAFVNEREGKRFTTYEELYRWSIEDIPAFWTAVWDFCGVKASKRFETVVDDLDKMPGARWFTGAELNFAENLLRYRDERTALISAGEAQTTRRMSYNELYAAVARLVRALRDTGVRRGDRVVGFMPNIIETVVAMLATTSIGAVWSSCSPDFGIRGVLDRFKQIEPKVMFTVDGYYFRGNEFDCLERATSILSELPSVEQMIVVPYCESNPQITQISNAVLYDAFIEQADQLEFEQVPSEHPVYIMYSSGTTGLPKCIVHSGGGTLLKHLTELQLHVDLKRDDVLFYFTTCGWMMWNWLVSSLAVGATLVLYDGSPFHPAPDALWKLAEDEEISIFGTSARYLAAIEKERESPKQTHNLKKLRTILSTGSPLSARSFEYVYGEVKDDVQLASISGGTDLIGCFATANPLGPVYAGELQCRGLGMQVAAFDHDGRSVIGQKGELVCTTPFPSMPIGFWNDPDQKKYRAAYFEKYPNVWAHGDYVEITDTGGVIIYGRSDATLNPGGVRIGTADIYAQVETLDEVVDSLAVGQNWDEDVRIILFVKLAQGIQLSDELKEKIRKTIRENATPRHVPAKIIAVNDIPYTISMKKVELAVRNIIHGEPVLNTEALTNPESLELFRNLAELQT
ncbi:MAG TPA: acetoacetate--CoA ligase, partial [Pyrinomonadaceae bacterium]|nr:acetoacetate--CoA ligase [Pyrinomonadaceae bacterium]